MKLILFLFIQCFNVCVIFCESNCKNFKTCGECIGYSVDRCVWCPSKEKVDQRCRAKNDISETWCNEEVYDPDIKKSNEIDEDFSKGEDGRKVIQFKPQKLKIKARPGMPVEIKMSYKPAKDYPLDIYYLIDYSKTMKDHVETLKNQGRSIPKGLANTTNNVRLGIGSFIEKPSMPFVDSTRDKSYSFKNHLSLTADMNAFTEALASPEFGANYDPPEASLDALMQVMTCMNQLGWRKNARRIIVLTTDSTYHSAGDGKFVGAYIRNDMRCHLENGKSIVQGLTFDYPSVSQINKVATENNFMVIFAASPQVESHYVALEKHVQGSKYVALDASPKLVEMIKEEYESLVRNMVLEYKIENFMRLTFDPDCSKADQCVLKHNKDIKITGTLTIDKCPSDNNVIYNVIVGPRLLNEKLAIEVEVDCQCSCEKPGNGETNSVQCSSAGTYQCGVCKCNENRSGDTCQCSGNESEIKDQDKCKAKADDIYLCSDHGTCSCGNCSCKFGYSGNYCEYHYTDCPSPKGIPCANHGSCQLGKCECDKGWLPDSCECPVNNNNCIAPLSNKECSGNGQCVCGECKCYNKTINIKGNCYGQFCDDCEDITATRCKEFEDYAYCNVKNNKTDCDLEFKQSNTKITFVNKTEINSLTWYEAKVWCSKIVEDNKKLVFRYHYVNKNKNTFLHIIIQNELEPLHAANIMIAAVSVVVTILLIGLVTLVVWKVLVDLHDKREYNRFYEESKVAGYDVSNPLYEHPDSNFINPAYEANR